MPLDQTYKKQDFTVQSIAHEDYENCTFINCSFADTDLSKRVFRECEFDTCDFSLATLKNTVLNDVSFLNCKLLGLHFEYCNDFLFSVSFENCLLNLSTFYALKLKKMRFKNCNLQEVDFSEADLSASSFLNCDLGGAIFDRTNLTKVDFRTAQNYQIDVENNQIKKAKFSREQIPGLLAKYDISIE